MTVTDELREIAGEIADQIEKKGHWQGGDTALNGKCCLVAGHGLFNNWGDEGTLILEVVRSAGIESVTFGGEIYTNDFELAINWNDTVPTSEVIDVLRAIEIG